MLSDSNIREELGRLVEPPPDPGPPPRSRAAILMVALVVLAVILWGGSIALLFHFERISPRVPDPRSGHVYRFNDQHRIFYLTAKQNYCAYSALAVSILASLAAAFHATRKKPSPKESF
jgi:hypothetical protein